MHKNWLIFRLGLVSILFATSSLAGEYDFLDPYEDIDFHASPEWSETKVEKSEPLAVAMAPFYQDFAQDGEITIFVGYGYEYYYFGRESSLYNMLWSLGRYHGLQLGNWQYSGDTIRFTDLSRNLRYRVIIGSERNAYMHSYSDYEVVLYHGHSRNGRGPAFGNYTNYFRMGAQFPTIELDTRNPYFLNEPMQLTDTYPPKPVTLSGKTYLYQYRGGQLYSSKLASSSYTKNIPGLDVDLKNTNYRAGRQIFYYYSCKNKQYWASSIRSLHPDSSQKLVFGTLDDSYGGTKPDAVMIISIVRQLATSDLVVQNLNATWDCSQCFTSY